MKKAAFSHLWVALLSLASAENAFFADGTQELARKLGQ
jgi:hypothetical protein